MVTPSPRIAVVQHEDLVPLDALADSLSGAELISVRAAVEPLPSLADIDGLIVLGGTMTAYDDDTAPWLPVVRDYLHDAVDAGVTTLGICLGAQLLAVALGGEVERSAPAGPERGVVELRMRPDAESDPLLAPVVAALGRDVAAPSSHEDAVSVLPDDAVWLASSRQYPFQAFRVGSAWGMQFHPEASLDTLVAWESSHGGDLDALRASYTAAADRLATLTEVIGTTFVSLVSDRVGR